ncbi:MAG: hypothetical protein HWN67_18185, partial [Candidatus Helarchaeota archaeon]|nr:hypothetical protein [Candidatus Helarchaeota archaeon]
MKDILTHYIDEGLKDVDFIDMRVQKTQSFIIRIVNGISREIAEANEKGLGIRAFKSGSWGFSCSNQFNKESVSNTMKNAIKLAKVNENKVKNKFKMKEFKSIQKSNKLSTKINIQDVD